MQLWTFVRGHFYVLIMFHSRHSNTLPHTVFMRFMAYFPRLQARYLYTNISTQRRSDASLTKCLEKPLKSEGGEWHVHSYFEKPYLSLKHWWEWSQMEPGVQTADSCSYLWKIRIICTWGDDAGDKKELKVVTLTALAEFFIWGYDKKFQRWIHFWNICTDFPAQLPLIHNYFFLRMPLFVFFLTLELFKFSHI